MDIFEFGDAKLRLKDLDPVYTALYKAKLPLATRQRFTLAEATFDHAGISARVAEAPDFWAAMHAAIRQTKRGGSRRYFRGVVAHNAIYEIRNNFNTGEHAVQSLQGSFREVSKTIRKYFPQFGPRSIFKLLDMAERVCSNQVDFSGLGIKEVCSSLQVAKGLTKAAAALRMSEEKLLTAMEIYPWATLASPRYDRVLNAQEFETLLCYYSHDEAHSKHLPGMDILDKRNELLWDGGKLAERLVRCLP